MPEDRVAALRYALTRDRRLALWKDGAGVELAGLAEWHGGAVRLDEAAELAALDELARAAGADELPGWVVRLLAAHGAPCRLASLERLDARSGEGGAAVDAEHTQPIPTRATPGTDFETLAAYVDGTLAAERRAEIEALVASDRVLGARVGELEALATRVAAKRAPVPRKAPAPPLPPPPATSETASWRGVWVALGAAIGLAVVVGMVALVLRLVGGGGESRAPSAAAPVASEPTVEARPAAAPRAALFDGERRIAVNAEGELEGLEGISIPLERRIVRALTDGEVPGAEGLAALVAPPPRLPDDLEAAPAELLEPVATRVLEELPVFRFRLGEGVRGARVRISDLAGREVALSPELGGSGTDWRPEQRLPRGRVLTWQLELRGRGRERASWPSTSFEAPRFELVRVDELAYAERELAAARGSRLAAALLYAELGALDEARSAIAELARQNPGSRVVGRLGVALARAERQPARP